MIVVASLALFGLGAVAWAFQRRLIYYPERHVPAIGNVLAGAEDVRFETADGHELRAWFVPATGGEPRATALVFNGNAGNRADRAPLGRALSEAGCAVLLIDYRAYGGNPGTPTEPGLSKDADAALAYVRGRSDVAEDRLVFFGESLGAAVAVTLAASEPPAALILRSPFTSLADVARVAFPFVPAGPFLRDRYASIERIRDVNCPTLVIAGSADSIVPPALSRRLFEASGAAKRWVLVEGADHNDSELAFGPAVVDSVVAFLAEYVA